MESRHKYGTFALGLALLAFMLGIFSTGATWATVSDNSSSTEEDESFGDINVDVALNGDLQLTEMDSDVIVTIGFGGDSDEERYSEKASYEELAKNSEGDIKSTFEDMDTAGSVAKWMIWIGIISMFITAILCFCTLAQITNSRFTTYSGSVATIFLFFAPIVWFILLPSGGTYTDQAAMNDFGFFFGESVFVMDFEPSPSTGLFLSLLGGLSSIAMMAMIYLHNRSELVTSKPDWISSILKIASSGEEKVAEPINFAEKKEQVGLLLQKSVNTYKNSRVMQAMTVLIILILVSIPLYSMLFAEEVEANAYQRELTYFVDGEGEYIIWLDGVEEISDGQTFSISLTEEDFPESADGRNIVSIGIYVEVLDYDEDNEELSGLGCSVAPGQDAPDSISYGMYTPAGQNSSTVEDYMFESQMLLELPEEGFGPYTGYTIAEIEDLFDTSDKVEGDYQFEFTANAVAGDSTIECDRSDDSVTVRYMVELFYFDVVVIEDGKEME